MTRALLWAAAVLAAAVGIWLYAVEPRDLTYWVHFVLVTPLLAAVIIVLEARLSYRLQWLLAIAIAPWGPIAWLLWPNAQWYLYGILTVIPLMLLAEDLAERRGKSGPAGPGGGDNSAWGLPDF